MNGSNKKIRKKIKEVKKEIKETPYNKSTSEHIGRLKAKLSQLKDKLDKRESSSSSKNGYEVKKSGDRTAVLVGYPSVGKSTLLSKCTSAESEVASYDFTTLKVIPGMLEYKGVRIQLLDVPGLIEGASSNRGKGKQVLSVIRNADLVIVMTDVVRKNDIIKIKKELYNAGIRLDRTPPKIDIKKRDRGGIKITSSVNQNINEDTIKAILKEYKISNAKIILKEKITVEDLVDKISGNRVYIPSLTVVNKIDKCNKNLKEGENGEIYISAKNEMNLGYLKNRILAKLDIKRIYLKPKDGGEVDLNDPLVVPKDGTIRSVCREIHGDFEEKFKYARIWGESAKFDGQQVGIEHKPKDGDIVSISTKKI